MLHHVPSAVKHDDLGNVYTLVAQFLRESCEGLRHSAEKAAEEQQNNADGTPDRPFLGTSMRHGDIPYNMQMDIDRLALENALLRFLRSGKKEDAYDIYFCYLEMFLGDYSATRLMIEQLSEYEANGSNLLMKHRDHYTHSVYVFALGLAIYEGSSWFREVYKDHYHLEHLTRQERAQHFLEYWGLTALFHDIGYPFELPFEQVEAYFETGGKARHSRPFMAYRTIEPFIELDEDAKRLLPVDADSELQASDTMNQYLAQRIVDKIGSAYNIDVQQLSGVLDAKPTTPDNFNYFMDHAYFSAIELFRTLLRTAARDPENPKPISPEQIDALTAILLHNSLYKFSIAHYKGDNNRPLTADLHPLAYLLMLCDELQAWDRVAYGRTSRTELHPMHCRINIADNHIEAEYVFDEGERARIDQYHEELKHAGAPDEGSEPKVPRLKAYSDMLPETEGGRSRFQSDIERIVHLDDPGLTLDVTYVIDKPQRNHGRANLSDTSFINLYRFAEILNGRWAAAEAGTMPQDMTPEQRYEWVRSLNVGDKDAEPDSLAAQFNALSLEYKLSNINQAKAFAEYLDRIGAFYTDKEVDYPLLAEFSESDLLVLGPLEHRRWLQEHYDMGWLYGTPSKAAREIRREHQDMIPDRSSESPVGSKEAQENYERLNQAEQDKDTAPMQCMLAMIRLYDGLRIYRAHKLDLTQKPDECST